MDHIMLDLETLGTGSNAVIASIGAVAFQFDPKRPLIGDKFYAVTPDWDTQREKGRVITGNTVAWWLQQSESAIRGILVSPDLSTPSDTMFSALGRFSNFVRQFDKPCIWGNGADFDNVILGSMYDTYGLAKPWSYGRNRCYRTVNSAITLPPTIREVKRVGTHHNALDDAIYQTVRLLAINDALGGILK